jgi:PHD/YefM family antitoxin component YafN of YafNO toxin-antitoxin module
VKVKAELHGMVRIEEELALNPGFIKEIEERRKEYKKGKTVSLEELKSALGE